MAPDSIPPTRRVDGHQGRCAVVARRWAREGAIPWQTESYAAALMASRADLALRDVRSLCCGGAVEGYAIPDELLLAADGDPWADGGTASSEG